MGGLRALRGDLLPQGGLSFEPGSVYVIPARQLPRARRTAPITDPDRRNHRQLGRNKLCRNTFERPTTTRDL